MEDAMCTKCANFSAYTASRFEWRITAFGGADLYRDGKSVDCLESLTADERLEALRLLKHEAEQAVDGWAEATERYDD
jgi:hypothetical protein